MMMTKLPVEDPLPSECLSPIECLPDATPDPHKHQNNKNMTLTILSLCCCMLTHSYLLISVFPYSGFLTSRLLSMSTDDPRVGLYAGVLSSSFMLGRAATSVAWGRAADRYGRRAVLLTSLLLSAVLSLAFGLVQTSFVAAVVIRCLLGCVNGIVLVTKTLVSELGDSSDGGDVEARRMGLVLGMWGWGFLVAPAIAGFTAEPIDQYPDVVWYGWFESWMSKYPFILPNVLGSTVCVLSAGLSFAFVGETIDVEKIQSPIQRVRSFLKQRWPIYNQVNPEEGTDSDHDPKSSTMERQEMDQSFENNPPITYFLQNPNIRRCLIVNWAFALVALTVDEAVPLFCLSPTAGFGVPEKEIGRVLSLGGLIFVATQFLANSLAQKYFGLEGCIRIALGASGPLFWLFPISLLLQTHLSSTGRIESTATAFLAVLLAGVRINALLFFSSISVVINRTVDPAHRATVNGLAVVGASMARGVGPFLAGVLMTVSIVLCGSQAAWLVFGVIGCMGLFVAVTTIPGYNNSNDRPSSSLELTPLEEPSCA